MDIQIQVAELSDCKVLPSGASWTDGRQTVDLVGDRAELVGFLRGLADELNMEVSERDPGPDGIPDDVFEAMGLPPLRPFTADMNPTLDAVREQHEAMTEELRQR